MRKETHMSVDRSHYLKTGPCRRGVENFRLCIVSPGKIKLIHKTMKVGRYSLFRLQRIRLLGVIIGLIYWMTIHDGPEHAGRKGASSLVVNFTMIAYATTN